MVIESKSSTTLVINSYFPTDSREINGRGDNLELTETIEFIKTVIEAHQCEAIIWAGDANADLERRSNHAITVSETVEEAGLVVIWDSFQVDFTHTYEREGKTFTSTIDHIFISKQLSARVTDAGVLHNPDNTSDHEPVFCVIDSIILTSSSIQLATPKPRPS